MRSNASVPGPSALPDHAVEEIAVLEIEMLTVEIKMKKLQARHDWLRLLHDNLVKRFEDYC